MGAQLGHEADPDVLRCNGEYYLPAKFDCRNENAASVYIRAGRQYAQQRCYGEAIVEFNKALQSEPRNALALRSRGEAKRMLGRCDEAIADFDKALQLEPGNALSLSRRGDAKRMLGRCDEAIADLDKALQLEPGNAFALRSRGEAKRMLGRCDEAIADLDKALQLEPGNAFALRSRGEAKRMLGRCDEAIADLDKALQLEPGNAFALRSRGEAKRQLGRYDEAIADLDKALQLEPGNALSLSRRGEAKRMLGRGDEAIADLNKALQLQPGNASALRRRGAAKRQLGRYDEAIADLDKALQLEPGNAFALEFRGDAKRRLGCYEDAVADVNEALRIQLDEPFALALKDAIAKSPEGAWWKERHKNMCSIGEKTIRIVDSTFDIIGAGPVGLCLAMSLAKEMISQRATPPASPPITVHENRWIVQQDGRWHRNPGSRPRDQVVTLQDAVVDLFPEEARACLEGERVWLHSRNVPVAQLEDRLLEKLQEPPFSTYIRLNRCERMMLPEDQAKYIKELQSDFIVAADGAGSLSRQGFKGAFVCPETKGAHAGEERIRLGQTDDNLEEADYALGIILREDACPPQPQSLNVVFTLAENIYLLNSQQGSKGFLNIRITKQEYDAIYEATGRRGCSFGSPIRIDFPEAVDDGTGPAFAKVNLPWLRRRIEEGLKLFGMRTEHMVGITGFQLVPAYVQHFCHVLPADEHVDKARVLLLAGDAAISHHFWPGRGLNTGLKSVKAIIRMFESETAVDGLQRYNTFMKKLRTREMQGRSASMMQKSLRLELGSTLSQEL